MKQEASKWASRPCVR